jgi:protein-tyrosine phosphatase
MNMVLPRLLWVGHAGDGRNVQQLFDLGIKGLVQVAAEEVPIQPPRELIYCRFPLVDGVENDISLLRLAVHTTTALVRDHVPTLVCCNAGLSRAPSVVAAALALSQNLPLAECLKRITEHHPSDVAPALWQSVVDLMALERP